MKSLDLSKPHAIFMIGIPGSGKTYFANKFSETFGAPFINTSKIRNRIYKTPTFSKSEESIVENIAEDFLDEALKCNKTVIFEGSLELKKNRQEIERKVKKLGYESIFVWVQTDKNEAKRRATKVQNENINQTVMSSEMFERAVKRFTAPSKNDKVAVISGKHTYSTQLRAILRHLASSNARDNSIKKPQTSISIPQRKLTGKKPGSIKIQ